MSLRFLTLSFLLLVFLGTLSQAVPIEESPIGDEQKQACQNANSTVIDVVYDMEVALDGQKLDRVNCSRLEQYSFPARIYPDGPEADYRVISSGLLKTLLIPFLSLPLVLLLALKTRIEPEETLIYFLGVIFLNLLGIAMLLISAVGGELFPKFFPSLLSICILSLAAFRSDEWVREKIGITAVGSAMMLWIFLALTGHIFPVEPFYTEIFNSLIGYG